MTTFDRAEVRRFLGGAEISLSTARQYMAQLLDAHDTLVKDLEQTNAEVQDGWRDRFAIAAMGGVAMMNFKDDEVAKRAYAIADFALAERLKRPWSEEQNEEQKPQSDKSSGETPPR